MPLRRRCVSADDVQCGMEDGVLMHSDGVCELKLKVKRTFVELCLEGHTDMDSTSETSLGSCDHVECDICSTDDELEACCESGRFSAAEELTVPSIALQRPPGTFLSPSCEGTRSNSVEEQVAEGCTTMMIKNVPLDCTTAMVVRLLDEQGFQGQFDFVYAPMDFRSSQAFGYAFVNMVSSLAATRLYTKLQSLRIWDTELELCWSTSHQGLEAHVERYKNSPVMHHSVPDDYKPQIFNRGRRASFPASTKKIKEPRLRRSSCSTGSQACS
jgi:hypothetical protein